MAPVYRSIEMEWDGKAYVVTPTYGLVQRIEQRISLASLLNRVLRGEPPLSQLADLLSECLRAAGCKDPNADAESINAMLYDDDTAEALTRAGTQILIALLPQKVKAKPGNSAAPAEGAPTTSTGESTTKSPLASSESSPPSSGG